MEYRDTHFSKKIAARNADSEISIEIEILRFSINVIGLLPRNFECRMKTNELS